MYNMGLLSFFSGFLRNSPLSPVGFRGAGQSSQVVQSALDCWGDWGWGWQMITLGLETVLVSDVGQMDDLTFGVGVLELALSDLSFQVGLTSVLEEALFFSCDAIAGFIAEKFITWLSEFQT